MTACRPSAWTVAVAAWTWPMAVMSQWLRASVLQEAYQEAPPARVSVTFASYATS